MKAFISYYGGKQRIASNLVKYFPKHTVYCEVFCGGCAVLLNKPVPKVTNTNYYIEVINDTNVELINFYKVLREQGKEFIKILELTPYSEYEHKQATLHFKDQELSDTERARLYYINICQSFSYKLNSGWVRSTTGRNQASTFYNHTQSLNSYLDRIKTLHIANADFEKCIKDWDSPQTLFYCDPPYVGANQGHYKGFTEEDFERLCNALDNCQGSFVLSSYKNEFTKKYIKDDWHYEEIEATMSACGGKNYKEKETKRTESLWIRLNKVEPSKDIIKLYKSGIFDCFNYRDKYTSVQLGLF